MSSSPDYLHHLCYFAFRMMHGDHKLFQSILEGDTKTLISLYNECFPAIKQLLLKNSGQLEDAEDVFQEALVVVFRKIKNNSLVLSCSLSTYVYSICRNMWLDRLRRTGRETGIIDGGEEFVDIDNDTIETIYLNDRYTLYQKHFHLLGDGCKKLLKLFFEGQSMKMITKHMGFGSEQYTRKRKFNCKEKLISSIKSDSLYAELVAGNELKTSTIK